MAGITEKERNVEELMRNLALDILALKVGETVTFPFRDGPVTYKRLS
jgi:hypothetical protein